LDSLFLLPTNSTVSLAEGEKERERVRDERTTSKVIRTHAAFPTISSFMIFSLKSWIALKTDRRNGQVIEEEGEG